MKQIKWRRLARLASQATSKHVTLTVTTEDFGDKLIAFVSFHEQSPEAHIVVNGNRVKSVKMLIRSIAHECAHVVLNSVDHARSHVRTMERIRRQIQDEYIAR